MNLKLFKKRLETFYSSWKKYKKDLWGNSGAIVICTPPATSSVNQCHDVSSLFYFWLLGLDFPDTIAVFTRNEICFICNKKKASILQTLIAPAMEAVQAHVIVRQREKGGDGYALMDEVLREMKVTYKAKVDSHESRPLVIGCISGESPKSKLLWCCNKVVKPMEYQITYINSGFWRLMKSGRRNDSASSKIDAEIHGVGMQQLPGKAVQMLTLEEDEKGEEKFGELLSSERDKKNPLMLDVKEVEADDKPILIITRESYAREPDLAFEQDSSIEYFTVYSEYDDWILLN